MPLPIMFRGIRLNSLPPSKHTVAAITAGTPITRDFRDVHSEFPGYWTHIKFRNRSVREFTVTIPGVPGTLIIGANDVVTAKDLGPIERYQIDADADSSLGDLEAYEMYDIKEL